MNPIIQSLMKKRETPKKQLCQKHGVLKVRGSGHFSPTLGNRSTARATLKICPMCEKEDSNKAHK